MILIPSIGGILLILAIYGLFQYWERKEFTNISYMDEND